MKVVLDTNVIISGLLWKRSTKALFDLADHKKIKVCLTPKIISEIIKVLNYPKIKKQLDSIGLTIGEIISYLFQVSKLYPDIDVNIDLPDKSDKVFLSASVISGAGYLITGDRHLLALKRFQKIKILKPNEFLKELKNKFDKI